MKIPLILALSAYNSKTSSVTLIFLLLNCNQHDKMQLFAKFKKILRRGFRATSPIIRFTNNQFSHEYFNFLHLTLPFLDVKVHLINNHIQTDLHTKLTDKHQYLLKISCHPNHTKKAIPFSLFLRIRRICSTDTFFDQQSRELIEYLTKRGYSRTSLQRDVNCVRSIPRHATLQPQEQKSVKTDRTPFVTSFNPPLPKISSVVNKYTTLLQTTANCRKVSLTHRL